MTKTKAQSVAEQLKALKGEKTPVPAKVEKVEKKKAKPGKQNAGGTGGARPGSGRKPLEGDEKRTTIKKAWENYGTEEIEVSELHAGTREVRKRKATRLRIIQDRLFAEANKGDVSAIKEFNDRVGGKARQPVVGDEDEDPVKIDLGVDRLLERAYGEEED